jgi:hypothetical protein
VDVIGLAVELAQFAAQLRQISAMWCSQLMSISAVKTGRRYLATNTRCASSV